MLGCKVQYGDIQRMSDQQLQGIGGGLAGVSLPAMREAVVWAYRLLLGREPNDQAAIDVHLGHDSVASLRAAFMATPEFRQSHPTSSATTASVTPDEAAIIDRFQPFFHAPAPAGSWYDFLGVRTRCAFLPDGYDSLSPFAMQGPPGSASGPLHDKEEWLGTLRSLLEARERLVVMELGAGWAPWLVSAAVGAARVGISDVQLVGVEGSAGHVGFMEQHMRDNGIDPGAHRLIHGVAGASDGIARFPRLAEPRNDYGSQAHYGAASPPGSPAASDMEEVPCYSLDTLLVGLDCVDLLHCDIQGMEGAVFAAARRVVNAKVRRVVIGTHSRAVEAELLEIFAGLGWILENETVCKLHQAADGSLHLFSDGCQVWRNQGLDHPT